MEQLLIETCKTFIKALDILKTKGKITPEQYEHHIKLKQEFLEIYSKSRTCKTTV